MQPHHHELMEKRAGTWSWHRVKDRMGRALVICLAVQVPEAALLQHPTAPAQQAGTAAECTNTFLLKHRNIAKFRNQLLPSER